MSSPAGSGAEPQPKSNLVHLSLKIWQLVATILMILFYFFYNLNIENYKSRNQEEASASSCLNVVTPMVSSILENFE